MYKFKAHAAIFVLAIEGVEGIEGRVKIGVCSQDTTDSVVF
jgi:hypothetical protein